MANKGKTKGRAVIQWVTPEKQRAKMLAPFMEQVRKSAREGKRVFWIDTSADVYEFFKTHPDYLTNAVIYLKDWKSCGSIIVAMTQEDLDIVLNSEER